MLFTPARWHKPGNRAQDGAIWAGMRGGLPAPNWQAGQLTGRLARSLRLGHASLSAAEEPGMLPNAHAPRGL